MARSRPGRRQEWASRAAVEGDLRGGYDVIVLANLDPPAAERVAQLIRKALAP